MTGLDTNVLARYYVQDESDAEATRQHEMARRLIESGEPLMVAKTVLLELEWVMRGYYGFSTEEVVAARVESRGSDHRPSYYGFSTEEVVAALRHLMSLPQVVIEQREAVESAIAHCLSGLDFADALHLASYANCDQVASFDDRKFARRAKRLQLMPQVVVPT
ncbi:MAG: PIN domain-containing protein [Gammaproteobacteria bacterium]|nr:PIN domain-containing protein [Gammaproteobacteria bacterium]